MCRRWFAVTVGFSYPVCISFEWSHHRDEEWLLQQSNHSTDHGLQASQGTKVVGWVAVGKTLHDYYNF